MVDNQQVPDFLDMSYLEHCVVPVALGCVAKETVEDMMGSLTSDGSELADNKQEDEERIAGICLNPAYLRMRRSSLKKMLKRNRNSLAFTIAELGECKLIPMVIKIDNVWGSKARVA